MDVQPTNGRRVPAPQQALPREALEALWRKLDASVRRQQRDESDRLRGARPERIYGPEVGGEPWFDDEVGSLLSEIERLKGELRAARQLRHQPDEEQLFVAPTTLAVLLLLARDVAEFRRARMEWLRQRETHTRTVLAMERVLEDLDLAERALRGTPWPRLQQLALEDLRTLARREAVA